MRLAFDPPFMPLQTGAVTVIASLALLWLYARRARQPQGMARLTLLSLRGVLSAGLCAILLNPVMVADSAKRQGRPPFLLLVDTSRSMQVLDGGGGKTRFEEAVSLTFGDPAFLDRLRRKYDVRTYGFSDRPEARDADSLARMRTPDGKTTSLGAALAAEANQAAGGRVLLVSDGRDTAESFPLDAARALRVRGAAVDTLCIGLKTEQKDLEVVASKSQVYGSPGQTVQIGAEVRSTGATSAAIRVNLLESGRVIGTKSVLAHAGRNVVSFPVVRQKKGAYRLAVQAESLPGERSAANNLAHVDLRVADTKARVLFLEGRPSWDSKFLAQALREDPSIALDVIYKLTESKFFAVLAAGGTQNGIELPRTVDQLSRYDVVIFGKGFEEFYDDRAIPALKEWVSERGGNILFLRGRADERSPSLRELEPVNWSPRELDQFRMKLTEEGQSHPGFAFDTRDNAQTVIQRMPPLITASRVQGEKTLAVVLARAEGAPDDSAKEMATLAYLRFGRGKSLAIAGQGMWRWAFLPPDLEKYGRVYQELWSQLVRWMVSDSDFLPGQALALHTDRSTYGPGGTVNLLGYVRAKGTGIPASLAITQPDGSRATVSAARSDGRIADFTASFKPRQTGEYRITVPGGSEESAPGCSFVVNDSSEEDVNTSADPDLMRQIASVGGGKALSPRDLSSLPDRLSRPVNVNSARQEPHTAWDRPWVLASLLGAACLEWWLRRRCGLA